MRTAVVTGAGSGVGQGVAVALAKRGWTLALIGHGRASLEATSQRIASAGSKSTIHVVDVTDGNAINKVADEIGPIDAWINAAAVGVFGPVDEVSPDDLDRVMAVSYNGVVHGSQAAVRHMKQAGAGVIVNIGSSLAYTTVPYNVPYAAAKAAVRSFSLGLSLELKDTGVTVCVAHLPAVATPWFAKAKTLTTFQSRPVGLMHSPALVGSAIADLVERPRRGDSYLGLSTVFVVAGARVLPRVMEWFAARLGVRLQTTKAPASLANNLWDPIEPPLKTPINLRAVKHSPRWWPPLSRSNNSRSAK